MLRIRRQASYPTKITDTVVGRVMFNQFVPEEAGFVDELLTKKKLQTIIADVYKYCRPIEGS
jgi:DNA-directed RNA polymerase subunit beta'